MVIIAKNNPIHQIRPHIVAIDIHDIAKIIITTIPIPTPTPMRTIKKIAMIKNPIPIRIKI